MNVKKQSKHLPVQLLVIDSIAAIFHTATTTLKQNRDNRHGMATITQQIFQISQILKRYADQYQLAILVINQITSSSTTSYTNHTDSIITTEQQQRAALGIAWYHCVSTRIELFFHQSSTCITNDTIQENIHANHQYVHNHNDNNRIQKQLVPQQQRQIRIVKSIMIEPTKVPITFQISNFGIC